MQEFKETVRQAPPALPQAEAQPPPTRWTLAYIQAAIPQLGDYSRSGLWSVLQDLDICYRRGRHSLHSPDADYVAKRDYAQSCVQAARQDPAHIVALYLDELSYYRQPSLAWCWWDRPEGEPQPPARLSQRSNTVHRIGGALDVVSGQVISRQASKMGVDQLVALYHQIRAHYPHAHKIYLIQDNWPVHFHPKVLAAAQATGIEMVRLPTYAPWLNPIEKFWRKLKQELLHMHRYSDRWEELRQRVQAFLERHAHGSQALLHYVGLQPEPVPT